MIRKNNGPIEWLEFELLSQIPDISHGVFLRHGGVSQDTFGSLNALRGIGDDENVSINRERIRQSLNLQRMVSAYQVHGKEVANVNTHEDYLTGKDGLMTNQINCGLLIVHADCQAAIFYDPVHKAIANVHAGWRGQVQNIYRETIVQMVDRFGSRPEDLLVCISPSLGPDNSEFINYRTELPEEFWRFQFKPTYFNLWEISQNQLEDCGVLPDHIEIAKIDTYANPSDFFSYRRERAKGRKEKITGGHATVVALL